MVEIALSEPEGVLVVPDDGPAPCAVLVLSGSSGRIEVDRVRLLARHGAAAMSIRWFGGPGQPAAVNEVPLESFVPALDRLAGISDHLGVIGTSRGAEVALLLAARDPRIRVVAAISPSPVVWEGLGPRGHSSWTEGGTPLPYVRYDDDWEQITVDGLVAFRTMYEQSVVTFADRIPAATIPVERITGEVLVTGGGDDQLWPSDRFAAEIGERRAAHGLRTHVLTHPGGGHQVRMPGEPVATGGAAMARGGAPAADAEHGAAVWALLRELLRLGPPRPSEAG